VGPEAAGAAPSGGLDLQVARYFVEKFPDRTASSLEVERASRPSFGCGAAEPQGKRQFTVSQVRTAMAEEERLKKLDEEVGRLLGFRVVECERKGGVLRVVAESPPGFAGDLKDAARKIEPIARAAQPRYSSLVVRARRAQPAASAAPPAAAPKPEEVEVRFEPSGREIEEAPAPRGP
jgi:hypothetical protein